MEILIAVLIMVILGTLFFTILPYLLPFFLILFLYSLYHNYRVRKQMRDYYERQQRPDNTHTYEEAQRSANGNPDVIDVEYSEETLDDEK